VEFELQLIVGEVHDRSITIARQAAEDSCNFGANRTFEIKIKIRRKYDYFFNDPGNCIKMH